MEKLLLRVDEAAQATGLGRSKLYELLASGELTSVAVGRSRRIPAEALRKWVAERSAEAEASRQAERGAMRSA